MTKTIGGLLRTLSLVGLALLSTSAIRHYLGDSVSVARGSPTGRHRHHLDGNCVGHGVGYARISVQRGSGRRPVSDRVATSTCPTRFQWAFSQTEGTYQVKVVVQNTSNQTSAHAADNFVVTSRRLGGLDAVNPTANPLVALFSGPPCKVGNTIRVRFNQLGSSVSQTTNAIPCSATNSANFYIAGMYPNSEYQMHHETVSPSGTIVQTGATYTFTTGSIPAGITFPTMTVPVPAGPPSSITAPILLQGYIIDAVPTATDLSGNVLWYYHQIVGDLTRTEPGGRMFVINSPKNSLYNATVREIDLAGNVTLANQCPAHKRAACDDDGPEWTAPPSHHPV